MTEAVVHEAGAPHGIQLDAVPVDVEQVRALPGDHMQRLLLPPQTVLMNAYPAGDPSWLRMDSTYPEQMKQRLALLVGVVVDVGPQGAQPMVAVAALATEDFLLMLPAEADAQGQVSYRLMSGALLFPNGRPGSASGPAHVGVGAALAPEGALRPVAGDEHRVVAHGP